MRPSIVLLIVGALLALMIVGGFLGWGEASYTTGDPVEDAKACGTTPPSLMSEEDLRRCREIREADPYGWSGEG